MGVAIFAWQCADAQSWTPTPTETLPAAKTDLGSGERVVVTGSHIPRDADEVPATPVVTIDRAGIENSGRTTISEVLRRLPVNTGNSFNEAFTDAFAAGSSGLSLRGLGQNSTLTLLNGRRVAPYALPQNATESFTDLNSIPQGAVERVEILKDGASAIYGADAIAGVVNVILREDFDGVEISSRYGNTTHSDAAELTQQLVTGIKEKWGSLLLTADYFKRNSQRLQDRAESQQANFTGAGNVRTTDPRYYFYTFPGGSGITGPGTLPEGTPYGFDYRSSRTFPGQFTVPGLGAVSAIPGSSGASAADFQPGYTPYNFNRFLDDVPETERIGLFSKAKYELFPWLSGFAEGGYSNVRTKIYLAPSIVQSDAKDQLLIGANNPYNPFGLPIGFGAGNDSRFGYRAVEFGPRINRIEQDACRAVTGLTAKLPEDFQFDAAFLYSQSRVEKTGSNYLSAPALRASLISSDPALAFNPFSGVEGANSRRLVDSLKATTTNDSKSQLFLYDGKLSGPVPHASLPAGPILTALGGEYRHEKLVNQSDRLSAAFQIVGQGGVSTIGGRDVLAGYYEVSVPVFSPAWNFPGLYALDLIFAQRYEDYSDFGHYSAPKFTIRFQPIKDLVLRGSYSEGVRAPSLSELAGFNVNFQTVRDPKNGGGGPDYQVNQGGNPNLLPEKSYAYYGGFVYSPSYVKGLSVSLDYSEIIRRRTITALGTNAQLQNEEANNAAGAPTVFRNSNGQIDHINDLFTNLGGTHVKAFDFEVNYNCETERFGTFSFDAAGTYLAAFKVTNGLPTAPGQNKVLSIADSSVGGFGALPDFKGQASIFWQYHFGTRAIPTAPGNGKEAKNSLSAASSRDKGATAASADQIVGNPQSIKLGLTVNYVDSYGEQAYNDADAAGVPRLNIAPTTTLRTVQSFTTLDALASYTFRFATFTVGINNLLDEKPPFIYGVDTNVITGYDYAQANSQGRFIYGEVKVKF